MKLLLDTHTFIWWESDPGRLSQSAADAIADEDNTVLLSLISLWEMQIKVALGKMTLSGALPDVIARQQTENGMVILPLIAKHIYELAELEDHHRDPFDRLLVAQARVEGVTLVTADPKIWAYDVRTMW